ncbi:hypothetical protein K2173_006413 [Erythroxylum novogranatense]|uniref:Uncharacterized protein n=1 Tax=Erythroxylum novogranatense TaxID=1862640 RepID=A0AAV8U7D9_9ROSI|nr:hypothetical protein K2173_006413 [Erythroxylum novogranatense]
MLQLVNVVSILNIFRRLRRRRSSSFTASLGSGGHLLLCRLLLTSFRHHPDKLAQDSSCWIGALYTKLS